MAALREVAASAPVQDWSYFATSDAYHEDLKAFIIQAVKDGHDIDEIILNQHWTEVFLAKFDVIIDDEFVADALKDIWVDMADGKTSHAKKYAYFDPNELGNSDGAMVGHYGNVSGSKVITPQAQRLQGTARFLLRCHAPRPVRRQPLLHLRSHYCVRQTHWLVCSRNA
ncbi:hypothetical protein GHK45_02075 [Sinorhizobium meliloti]|uniref:Uncharacterized protein n=1 Tax=Rhizobium meliloti TaxID=382 RepID=A0A6A7ZKU1_RHIML|nr:hypothetical protein [Sinorhizobium meliloti]MQW02668.1 hypothetical protein [Sinorhizobium meliloti]